MQPRYSFTGVTKDLQDLILSETCLQALVHEVHHLPSWGEKRQEWEQACQIGSSLVQAPILPDLLCLRLLTELWLHSQHATFMSSNSKLVTSFSLSPPNLPMRFLGTCFVILFDFLPSSPKSKGIFHICQQTTHLILSLDYASTAASYLLRPSSPRCVNTEIQFWISNVFSFVLKSKSFCQTRWII